MWYVAVSAKANEDTNTNKLVRSDGRCGSSVKLSDGSPAQCDPETEFYCCSKWGYCGSTSEHCDCSDCVNYRNKDTSGTLYTLILHIPTHIHNWLEFNTMRSL